MLFVELLLVAAAFAGHLSWCVWLYNRLHARHLPRGLVFCVDRSVGLLSLLIVVAYGVRWLETGHFFAPLVVAVLGGVDSLLIAHAVVGITVALAAIPLGLLPRLMRNDAAAALTQDEARLVDVREPDGALPVHGWRSRLYARLPGNQIAQLSIHEKELRLPRWPAALDGLTIVQLSDLHMTGKMTRPFYDAVVRETAALKADLLLISGDIAENPECLPWIGETLGSLRAPLGQFFVLGNHELRLPAVGPLRDALRAAGWNDVAGRTLRLEHRGQSFLLSGNEQPWFGVYPPRFPAGIAIDPTSDGDWPRILLAHTPDLYPWAREQGFDLMLAGHTHGGQIRFPCIGPLVAPSRFGHRYAAGVFHEGPTVMHVSRGLAGEHLLRFACPPELTRLKLRGSQS